MGFWTKAAYVGTAAVFADPAVKVVTSGMDNLAKVATNEKAAYQRGFEEGYQSALKYVERAQLKSGFRTK